MSIKDDLTSAGAEEYAAVCLCALQRQLDRLETAKPPPENWTGSDYINEFTPDVWFAANVLHRSFLALDLTATALQHDPSKQARVAALGARLPDRAAIKRARDMYEHFDEYLKSEGRLQEGVTRPDHILPGIGIQSGPIGAAATITGVTITLGIGMKSVVDVFDAIKLMIPALKAAVEVLRE